MVFYWAYREWLSWLLLVCLLALPWFSLLVSLPATLKCRVRGECPTRITCGEHAVILLRGDSALPLPPIGGGFTVSKALTGQQWKLKSGDPLPTNHCGKLTAQLKRVWCLDYLGLFRLPVRHRQSTSVLVFPRRMTMDNPPDVSRYLANSFRPKRGGGFAENHELRLYRPGDDLRHVHWKLSAKTGKLVYREPMEALRGLAVLTLELSGTPEMLDDKLGRLQYLSEYLLRMEIPHQICCLTGSGLRALPVSTEEESASALALLLGEPPAAEGERVGYIAASWRYHIGGDSHEA